MWEERREEEEKRKEKKRIKRRAEAKRAEGENILCGVGASLCLCLYSYDIMLYSVMCGAAWCCVVLRGAAWSCVVLRGPAWCCMLMDHISLFFCFFCFFFLKQ